MADLKTIQEHIEKVRGKPLSNPRQRPASGGCINEAFVLEDAECAEKYFVKTNDANSRDMFEAEAEGLEELHRARAIRVPKPIGYGVAGRSAYLVVEYVPMGGRPDPQAMGQAIAKLHQATAKQFGWHRNNTIGLTPQLNEWRSNWVEFYREHRLRYQFQLASQKGQSFKGAEQLMERLPAFFDGYDPEPSLLHGDLWGGNADYTAEGEPVIYDPAVYYGDREADIAFTEMFGGFGYGFYRAYEAVWPLDKGYATRKKIYNLYHLLNHFNLFGGHYASSSQRTIDELLCG